MTRAEWIELGVIVIVSAASWPASSYFPSMMPLWQIVLGFSALLLAQSLVRDVAILLRRRRSESTHSVQPRREAQCFCLESTVGVTGVAAAAMLVWLGSVVPVTLGRREFSLAVAGTMALSFLIKDWVVSWDPPSLRREKDHLNLVVRWKAKSK